MAQMIRDLQGGLRWWESPGGAQMVGVSRWGSDDRGLQVGSDDEGLQVGSDDEGLQVGLR